MTKHVIKISLLLLWVGLMGWWWHESRSWPAPEKIDAAFLPSYNDYYAIYYNERKIGWSFRSLSRQPDGGYQAANGLNVRLRAGHRRINVRSNISANLDETLNLIDFTWAVQAGEVTLSESGVVADGRLSLDFSLGRHQALIEELLSEYKDILGSYLNLADLGRPVVLTRPEGPGLAHVVPSYLSYLGLEPGRRYSLTLVEPVSRSLAPLAVRIEDGGREYDVETARQIKAYKVYLGPEAAGTTMWLDDFGRVFKEEAMGLSLVRTENFGEARSRVRGLELPSMLTEMFKDEKLAVIFEKGDGRPGRGRRPEPPDSAPANQAGQAGSAETGPGEQND